MGACASDKASLYAYTITMAHEEALVLTKEWDPRTFPIFFILSCRAFESHWRGGIYIDHDASNKVMNLIIGASATSLGLKAVIRSLDQQNWHLSAGSVAV